MKISETEPISPPKNKVKKRSVRILSTFLFLCVVVASFQTSFYIPVFSDFFSPPNDYVITIKTANHQKISFDLNVNINFDFKSSLTYVYIVGKDSAKKEFLDAQPLPAKFKHRKEITSQHSVLTFVSYFTNVGDKPLKANTEYYIVITVKDEIVFTELIRTDKFDYVSQLNKKTEYNATDKLLYIQPVMNDDFANYTEVVVQMVDVDTNTVACQSRISKVDIKTSWATLQLYAPFSIKYYKIEVYLVTMAVDSLDYSKVITLDDAQKAYLVYTHSIYIKF